MKQKLSRIPKFFSKLKLENEMKLQYNIEYDVNDKDKIGIFFHDL